MRIAVPREIKAQEYRVGLTPEAVTALSRSGHRVVVEHDAGIGSGYDDAEYRAAGAEISPSAASLYAEAELVVKVKEPQPQETDLLRPGLLLFCYLHLAPLPDLTTALLNSGASCIAYETVTDSLGRLPLLRPMSEIAGRLSVQAGAHCLEKAQGGAGVLLGSVAGLAPGHVLIFGGGVVGSHAADVALGMGARVTMMETNSNRRQQLRAQFTSPLFSVAESLALAPLLPQVDMVVGAVLIPGAAAPKLLRREHLSMLAPGSVLVDVAVDQGGCFESTRPTSHGSPTFCEQGIVHYCVANIPSAVARTASRALSLSTLPYVERLASGPLAEVLHRDAGLAAGLNVHQGKLYCAAVAAAQERQVSDLSAFFDAENH